MSELSPSSPKINHALRERRIRNLIKADLQLAAEAFGAELDEETAQKVHTATCPEDLFIQKVTQIAEISGDRLLAERARQRAAYPGLKHYLPPAAVSVLHVYTERFYSFWDEGKQFFIKSELSDFPQWYEKSLQYKEEIFSDQDMESILAMSCSRDQIKKTPLLKKLLDNILDSEIIRTGYLYPVRDTAYGILSDFFMKLKELLLIRGLHNSALQLGEHPEDLLPYVWANIIKNILSFQTGEILENINVLAYLHYGAHHTESRITGSDAYTKLKKEFVLFNREMQRNWPNEIRKMYLDPATAEELTRCRFAHGLTALNTLLAYRYADKKQDIFLEEWEEDSIVRNGLILTQTGYVKSSGFDDSYIKEQFLRDIVFFKEMQKNEKSLISSRYFHWHRTMKKKQQRIENSLPENMRITEKIIESIRETANRKPETEKEEKSSAPFSFTAFLKGKKERERENCVPESGPDENLLHELNELRNFQETVSEYIKDMKLFFH